MIGIHGEKPHVDDSDMEIIYYADHQNTKGLAEFSVPLVGAILDSDPNTAIVSFSRLIKDCTVRRVRQ